MREYLKFYIDGRWIDPADLRTLMVEDPATEQPCGTIAIGGSADVDNAVQTARRAFRPTVFADVRNDMTIAREEIFGPVLCILGYGDLDEVIEVGNDTDYGPFGYVSGADLEQARAVARRIRAGTVSINHALDIAAPFGGYKQSGNGREWGELGLHEYLETQGIVGFDAAGNWPDPGAGG